MAREPPRAGATEVTPCILAQHPVDAARAYGSAVLLGITIIGLPFARQHLNMLPLALFPFGRELR
jgi:hypothetical protein